MSYFAAPGGLVPQGALPMMGGISTGLPAGLRAVPAYASALGGLAPRPGILAAAPPGATAFRPILAPRAAIANASPIVPGLTARPPVLTAVSRSTSPQMGVSAAATGTMVVNSPPPALMSMSSLASLGASVVTAAAPNVAAGAMIRPAVYMVPGGGLATAPSIAGLPPGLVPMSGAPQVQQHLAHPALRPGVSPGRHSRVVGLPVFSGQGSRMTTHVTPCTPGRASVYKVPRTYYEGSTIRAADNRKVSGGCNEVESSVIVEEVQSDLVSQADSPHTGQPDSPQSGQASPVPASPEPVPQDCESTQCYVTLPTESLDTVMVESSSNEPEQSDAQPQSELRTPTIHVITSSRRMVRKQPYTTAKSTGSDLAFIEHKKKMEILDFKLKCKKEKHELEMFLLQKQIAQIESQK